MINYKFIKEKPNRNCRAETLIRLLVSTSYSKTQFSNIILSFGEAFEEEDMEFLENLSTQLRTLEKGYGMLDFARSIEIVKRNNTINFKLNIMKFDTGDDQIVDIKDNHETLVDLELECDNLDNKSVQGLAVKILNTFYHSQKRNKGKVTDLSEVEWVVKTRHFDKQSKEDNLFTSSKSNQTEVIEHIKKSLLKNNFTILLLQNKLILADQRMNISVN